MRLTTFFAFSTLALFACRGDDANNTDANGSNGSNGSGASVTIQMVQNDAMAPGTPVTLRGVVVTAIDNFGGKMGDIWVEEPEGGTYSGVHIFGAASTDVAALAVGDTVDVTGAVKDEFALTGSGGDTSGRTVTELKPATSGSLKVTKTGTGTVPAPVAVDALMIGQMADADTQGPLFSAAWEPYEGVLVSVNSVSALGAPKKFGSTGAADAFSFDITGVARVEGNFTDITMSGIQRNTCMNITGVVDYFFDYLVLPRSAADLNTGASGCPVAEATCADSIDNDGNGFADCKDNNCMITDGTCRPPATISSIDTPATPPAGGQEIGSNESVCVTALNAKDMQSFWVAKGPGTAAANEGLYVFAGGQARPNGLAVGSKVDVIGTVSDFSVSGSMPVREYNELQTTIGSGACAVAASPQTIATLTGANGRQWIGSLVTITNVAVVDVGTSANFGVGHLKSSGVTFESMPDVIGGTGLPAAEMSKCYATITGIWYWDVHAAGGGAFALEPLAVGTGTGTCN